MLHGTWDLPGPGLDPMSPALAGGFLTTAPPGKTFIYFRSPKFHRGPELLLFSNNNRKRAIEQFIHFTIQNPKQENHETSMRLEQKIRLQAAKAKINV